MTGRVLDATANESMTDMQIRQVGISEGNERDGNMSSITDAFEAANLILLPEMLSLSKKDLLMKVDEFCPDTETLRYTRDLLFHITRWRRGIKKSISLVECEASEHVRSKLIYLSVCLSVCLSACLPACLPVCLSSYLAIYLSSYPSYLSVCVSVYVRS